LARYFFDTSAAVKYYHREPGTERVAAIFAEPDRKIQISSLGFLEIQSSFAMKNLRELIREMDRENPTWGEERIADELKLKLGIKISPRTVGKCLDLDRPHRGSGQKWATFVRSHAKAIVACDFLISATATFRLMYVLVAMEIGSRRILHVNVTEHPTAEWTRNSSASS
jgi:hypothetical protein